MGSLTLVMLTLIAAFMAWRLANLYAGGHYVCPSCGARRADRHGDHCQWRR